GMVGTDKDRRSTFGAPERQKVLDRIEGRLDVDSRVESAVRGALRYGIDPTPVRLAIAFEGADNQSEILGSIDQAGVDQVVRWSNVPERGPTADSASLEEKYDAYRAVRQRYEAAEQAGPVDPKLEEEHLAARNRFWDHRLDLSSAGMEYFTTGGGDF